MGIYDREYYRGETRGAGWFATTPVCKTIILANVLVFLLQEFHVVPAHSLRDVFAATGSGIFHEGKLWQLLTATFLHDGLIHLLLNMYFFWVVGRELEPMYGPKDFAALYLSAAVFSTFGWAVFAELSGSRSVMLGASGAVFAVVVLYTLYYPRRELLFMFVIPMEMWIFVGLFVAYQVYVMLRGNDTQTAVEAHVSGALYGYLFKRFDLRWSRMPWNRVRRPRLRVVPADPPRGGEKPAARPSLGPVWSSNAASSPKPASTAVVTEEQLDARLDEVLAKIAREGRGGLTEEENRVLQEASRRARNRRSDRL